MVLKLKEYTFNENRKWEKLKNEFEPHENVDYNKKKYNRESIPNDVKREVWRPDGGECVMCGSKEKIEFDHIIPVFKGWKLYSKKYSHIV